MAGSTTRGIGIGTGIVAAVAVAIGAATAVGGTADQAAWQKAMHVRSEGLNARYGLGHHPLGKLSAPEPGWRRALAIRSAGLNLKYGLGDHALGTSTALRRHEALGLLNGDRQQVSELLALRIDRAHRLSSSP